MHFNPSARGHANFHACSVDKIGSVLLKVQPVNCFQINHHDCEIESTFVSHVGIESTIVVLCKCAKRHKLVGVGFKTRSQGYKTFFVEHFNIYEQDKLTSF